MADPYIGEIRMFAGNFAPAGWALCDGQILGVQQNSALFSILGTTYGGNGSTSFGLPDLRGRVAVNQGAGPGLSTYSTGDVAGTENVTLSQGQMPAHNHTVAVAGAGNTPDPTGAYQASVTVVPSTTHASPYSSGAPTGLMNAAAIGSAGSSQPLPVLQPLLCVTFMIALTGIYPPRP